MNLRRRIREVEQAGYAYARELITPGSAPPQPAGESFARGRLPSLVARRALIAMRLSPDALATIAAVARGPRWRQRVERFLSRYAWWWGVRRGLDNTDLWKRMRHPPLILMYHAIGHPGEPASTWVLPQRRLQQQLAWLRRRGYRFASLSELISDLRDNRLPPARTVVLTFDDGYADNHELALPILARYGAPATVFMVSGSVGGVVSWTPEPAVHGRRLLTRDQIAEMLANGIEIGSHTRTHASLTGVPVSQAAREVGDARTDLEELVGRPVRTFAYPFGDYNQDVARLVERAGYDAAVCSRSGFVSPGAPLYELPRVEIRGDDSLLQFALMVLTGSRSRPRSATRSSVRGAAVTTHQA